MASTKKTYAVWAPYCTDSEMLQRRADVRPKHLEGIKAIIAKGMMSAWSFFCLSFLDTSTHSTTTELGGPTSDPVTEQPTGSMFVFEAENLTALREYLDNDPYCTGKVVRTPCRRLPTNSWLTVSLSLQRTVGYGKDGSQIGHPCSCHPSCPVKVSIKECPFVVNVVTVV